MKTLLADPAALKLEKIALHPGVIAVHVRTCSPAAVCPSCGELSARVHSRYARKVADLPWEGIGVRLLLLARKFFFAHEACRRRVFCERLPSVVAPYGRATLRLGEALTLRCLGGRKTIYYGRASCSPLGQSRTDEGNLNPLHQKSVRTRNYPYTSHISPATAPP